jgi:hypothetical protein
MGENMKRIAMILSVCTGGLFILALVSCVYCSIAERNLPKGGANIGLGILYITLFINIPTIIVWCVYFIKRNEKQNE